MKTTNLIKISVVILLGITLSGKVQANDDKNARHEHPVWADSGNLTPSTADGLHNMVHPWDQPLEDWMFESDYLNEEPAAALEPWMLEADYLEEDSQPLESWMFSISRLSDIHAEWLLEPWMFESDYLSNH